MRIDETGNEYVMVDVTDGEFLEEADLSRSLSEVSSVATGGPIWICCNLDTGASSVPVFPKRLFQDLQIGNLRLRAALGEVVQERE